MLPNEEVNPRSALKTSPFNLAFDFIEAALSGHGLDDENIEMGAITALAFQLVTISASLKLRRNQSHAITSLPRHVLGSIFFFYAFSSHLSPNSYSKGELYRLEWTTVMLVCWEWYHVAQEQAILWSFLEFGHEFHDSKKREHVRLQVQLRLSSQQLLTVKWQESCSSCCEILEPHLHRVRALSFKDPDHSRSTIKRLASEPLPRLERISLGESRKGLAVPAGFFNTSALRSVKMVRAQVEWDFFRGLQHLKIDARTFSQDSENPLFRHSDVLGALHRMPGLKTLHLEGCLANKFADDPPLPSVVSLPKLTHVWLDGTVEVLLYFLSVMRVNPGWTHHLAESRSKEATCVEDSALEALLELLRHHYSGLHAPQIRSLCLESFYRIEVQASTNVMGHKNIWDIERGEDDVHLYIGLEGRAPRHALGLIEKACQAVGGDSVTILDAQYASGYDALAWFRCMSILPKLDTIHIMADFPHGPSFLWSFLRRLGGVDAPRRPNGSRIPALRHIYLHLHKSERRYNQDDDSFEETLARKSQAREDSIEALTYILEAFQEMGLTLNIYYPRRSSKFITPDVRRSFEDLGACLGTHGRQGKRRKPIISTRKKDWVTESESSSGLD